MTDWDGDDLPITQARAREIETRLRRIEEQLDTLGSPLWKRVLFRLDGWPRWSVIAARPAWRPWRRWFLS